jgi:hypothetical protein
VETLGQRFRGVDAAAESFEAAGAESTRWAKATEASLQNFQVQLKGALGSTLGQYDASLAASVKSLGAIMEELETTLQGLVELNRALLASKPERGA